MDETQVILVDIVNNEIGLMNKIEAHEKGMLHRAISVFIKNTKNEWLLQRRAAEKYHSSNLWTNACCSHPLPGESNLTTAQRRLKEEMGLACNLTELFNFSYKESLENGLTEHELDFVFFGITDQIPEINMNEVSEYKYLSFYEIDNEIKINPENYTIWFRKIYQKVNELTCEIFSFP